MNQPSTFFAYYYHRYPKVYFNYMLVNRGVPRGSILDPIYSFLLPSVAKQASAEIAINWIVLISSF